MSVTNLERVYARFFSKKARERGEDYFFGNLVLTCSEDDFGIHATVAGTEVYEVYLPIDNVQDGECGCPAFEKFGPCKHMWAVLCEAEDLGCDLPNVVRPRGRSKARAKVKTKAKPKPPEVPAWRRRVEQMARVEQISDRDLWAGLDGGVSRIRYLITHYGRERWDDDVLVHTLRATRLKNGEWGADRPLRLADAQPGELSEDDRAVFAFLRRAEWGRSYYTSESRHQLDAAYAAEVLVRMARTGRLAFEGVGVLAWDDGAPWSFVLEASTESGERVVSGWLERAEERIEAADVLRIVQPGMFVARGRIGLFEAHGAQVWLDELLHGGPISVPESDAGQLVELIARLPAGAWRGGVPDVARGVPQPRLLIAPVIGSRAACAVAFEYDDAVVNTERVRRDVSTANGVVVRDLDAERGFLAQYLAAGGTRSLGDQRAGTSGTVAVRAIPELVNTLLEAGWLVEAEGQRVRSAGATSVSVKSGIDWFELEGGLAFDDQEASLPELLRAAREGSQRVRLGDGSVGILPEDWLASWRVVELADGEVDGRLRFRGNQGWLLDALLAEKAGVERDAGFKAYGARLARFKGVRARREPRGFRGELRPYQRDSLGWFHFLRELGLGGCLADDMGLGKTVQVLALLESRRLAARRAEGGPRPSLVVVPRSLVFNWIDEAARFTPNLRTLDYTGADRRARRADAGTVDLLVTTYGVLRRDAAELADVRFDYVVLDEATAIKNATSQAAKAARLLNADHRLALSGTPIENHVGELWSLFEFLNPGMLGRTKTFQKLCAAGEGAPQLAELARALRPFFLRRTKGEVLHDLPPKSEQLVLCDLDRTERKRYDELLAHYRAALLGDGMTDEGLRSKKIQVLEALLRLRQAACHPGLIDSARSDESSAKLDALLPRLDELAGEGHKVLVFSQFTSLLRIVRARLDDAGVTYEYLDGRTRKRKERVERFQSDPDCPLFLISLKAGGHGLNLTASDYVFLLDPWWNPAVESQAIDRAHRLGQTRAVFAYRLIARDTVEQRVLELQERKRELAQALLGEGTAVLKELTREDLEGLLS